ncbi:hypothetical protein ACQPYK_45555 [Streptosporangium sp. CA-135522]|uniref:hypothetical protein n=1 Tax=Streptosporangium sp. CA-135522 TaxID=3240072 RepID=UPI003D8FBA39
MTERADGFAVFWDHMRRAGTDWSSPADRIRKSGDLIDSVLADAPWGRDQYAEQFRFRFAETLEDLADACRRGADSMNELTQCVGRASDCYRDADQPRVVQA